jgi:phosphomannomutase
VSVSGIRGLAGQDLDAAFAAATASKFGAFAKGGSVALACDTRSSSFLLKNAVSAGLTHAGCTVFDLGYSSTPSVFKEVSRMKLDGGMIVTASHNPPEWNGMKFVVRGGRGVFENELEEIQKREYSARPNGKVFHRKAIYTDILRAKAGKNTAAGIRLALDLAGGVGSLFVSQILEFQGCRVHSIHDSPGIFPRIIDPTADPLIALTRTVKNLECDAGFAYDCDADRLVIVDEKGEKLSGDATLLVSLHYYLENSRNRNIAVSVDTSLAAEDLVREYNGRVYYAKVGEANVVKKMIENDCGAGGEGSSGGYIEPGFVMCRDGVYASTMISKMIKTEGSLKSVVSNFKRYYQDRTRVEIGRSKGGGIVSALAETEKSSADVTDGVKIRPTSKSWVLIRASNTEDAVRISAEATTPEKASQLVRDYSKKVIEISERRD